jgi:LmbE family N-acetylglucosaminyl deacetylase
VGEKLEPVPPADADVGPLSAWLVWWAAVVSSIFAAWILLPSAYLFAGLFRPGAAGPRIRLDMFWMQYIGLTGSSAWVVDPVRTLQTALGMAAGLTALLLLVFVAVRVLRTGGRAWPGARDGSSAVYMTAQAGLAVTMAGLAVLSITAPVPARPLDWWFLASAGASATLWVSRRSPAMAPAACVLSMSTGLALLVDVLAPPSQALLVPGGWIELVCLLAAVTASVACAVVLLRMRPHVREGFEAAVPEGRGALPAALLAALFGVMVVAMSAAGTWASLSYAFGSVRGRDVVVFSPHMDDEAAFAGETISWLSRNGARVTVVFTTDSRGARALDKDHSYIARRRVAMSEATSRLGVSSVVVFDDVKDGNRMRGPRKIAAIERKVRELGLVRPGTIVMTVSGTGHSDHRATFAAARAIAGAARLPLFIAWGYDDAHDTITSPTLGRPLALDGGPDANSAKAGAVDDYIRFFQDDYPWTLPRVLLSSRGVHDTLSVLDVREGAADRAAKVDPVARSGD